MTRGALLEPGVSQTLADARRRAIRGLSYDLSFRIPAEPGEPIQGHETLRFDLTDVPASLVLDFDQPASRIVSVQVADMASPFTVANGHLIVPSSGLRPGPNRISIAFVAGDDALNRNADYLYSLFVPARARLTFPCFDQPDLKARYTLALEVPPDWEAVANGAEQDRRPVGDRVSIRFAETEPLPTYLFAFAAGRFQVERAERDGRVMRMLHRETDATRLARNRDALFDQHATALAWLEDYTGIAYPFGKFDFVLIPSFQFSGMEHPGAILYNASSLLLDDTATQAQELARASTIAHETAHMWFGDLVTMEWFNDVWMKEVFANFFAAKIVNPTFPDLDHDLRFLMAHHPAAYEIDRTAGANPIRQPLGNLRDAGSLYGAIIYQKAPIVMRQLELLIGETAFQTGLREYLARHAMANATWPDLIHLLDARTDLDLAAWSHAWVEEPARPTVHTELEVEGGRLRSLRLTQQDPRGRGLVWSQRLQVVISDGDRLERVSADLNDAEIEIPLPVGRAAPRFVLANGTGHGYGLFELDPDSRRALLQELPQIPDALVRGAAWVTLWDEVLEGRVGPAAFLELARRALPVEQDELNVQRILTYAETVFWHLLPDEARDDVAPGLEQTLREGLVRSRATSLKASYFSALQGVALTPETVDYLARVWRRQEQVPGLTLSENDESALAMVLAVREVPGWEEILQRQLNRIENADRRERFAFLIPAAGPDHEGQARFFASLSEEANRRHEPWVLQGLALLHHPLRAGTSVELLLPGLELLEDVQRFGDIFFPKRWLDATVGRHHSARAAAIVREFLDRRPDYPDRLREIILQSSDLLFRASRMLDNEQRAPAD